MNYFVQNGVNFMSHYVQVDKKTLIDMLDQYQYAFGKLPPIQLWKIDNDNMYFIINYNRKKNIFQKVVDFFR